MKNQIKSENINSTNNVSVNVDRKPEDITGDNDCFTTTPMAKQEVITLEYAVSYLFAGIEIAYNPSFKQIVKAFLRLMKVMLFFPIYTLYALTVLDERLDPKLWFILIIPFGSYWLHKCIPLILILLLK